MPNSKNSMEKITRVTVITMAAVAESQEFLTKFVSAVLSIRNEEIESSIKISFITACIFPAPVQA